MDANHRLILKRASYSLFALGLLATLPFLFQSCAEPLDGSRDVSSLSKNAPFAFEHKFDQIAYMSCSNMSAGYNANAYFTFKAGAYGTGNGLKLNNNYTTHVRNVAAGEKAQILAESDANSNVYLSLGVRLSGNLQSGYRSDSNFVGALSAPAVANVLAATNGTSYSSNFPALGANAQLEDTAHYTQSENGNAQVIRDAMNSGAYLATTYNKVGADTLNAIGSSPNSPTSVYGLGFKANFNTLGFALNTSFAAGPLRVMTNLQEFDLTTGSPTSSVWDCKPEWKFMIVKPTDSANCVTSEPNLSSLSAAQLDAYIALRQMLPPTNWGVNLTKRCIVPTAAANGSCYGSGAAAINYLGGVCDPVAGTCPHYLSICKRR